VGDCYYSIVVCNVVLLLQPSRNAHPVDRSGRITDVKFLLPPVLLLMALCSSSWAADGITTDATDGAIHVSETMVFHGKVVETSIDAKEAVNHVGEIAWVDDQITQVYHFPDGSLNLDVGGTYPNQIFSIYVSSSLLLGTTMDWKRRRGDWVSVRGKVEMDNGKPEIKIQEIDQMSFTSY